LTGFSFRNLAAAIAISLVAVAFFLLFLKAPSHQGQGESDSSLQDPEASTDFPRYEGTKNEPTKNGLSSLPDFNVDLAKLSDPNLSMKSRIGIAREIGEKGRVELWQTALAMTLPMNIREALLESIGSSGQSEAGEFLKGYLGDPEQGMRRSAIRGLATTGQEEDAQTIGSLMGKQGLAIEESTEVALALGESRAPNATTILLQAYPKADRDELVQCLILGLAQRPFGQTQQFFQQILGDPATGSDRKQEVLTALGQFDSVKEDFFGPYLQSPDPEVRSGAYLGLGVLTEGNPGPRLLIALEKESDPQARLSLIEALGMKSSGDPWAMNRIAIGEKEPIPRILAVKAVAQSLQGREPTDAAVVEFGRVWAPELARLAIEGSNTEGLQAVLALSIRKSPEVRVALRQVASQSQDTKVQAAAQKALLGMENPSGFK
jgi:HEAT repeat protein